MQRFMIDTNILIHTIKNRPDEVRRYVEAHDGEICASRITAMDLLCGAHKFHAVRRNLGVVEGVLARLDFDLAAVEHAGQIRTDLASSGRSI
jgi:tRNA(fMet)-specific endonuclease VapC